MAHAPVRNLRSRMAIACYTALMAESPDDSFLSEDSEWSSELGSVLTHNILDFDLLSVTERRDLAATTLAAIGAAGVGEFDEDAELAEAFMQHVWSFFVDRALNLWRALGGHMELKPGMDENLPRRFNHVPEGGGALFYVVTGALEIVCEGHQATLTAGQMLVVPQNHSVEFGLAADSDYCSAFNLCFITQRWMEYLPFEQSSYPFLHVSLRTELARRSVSETLTRLIDISHADIEHRQQMIQNQIEFLLMFCKDACATDQNKTDPRVLQACNYIRAHYAEKISIEQIASAAGVSASALTSLFKNHIGMNMMRWRDQLRMQKAIELLEGTDQAIKAIAIEVGYEDPLFFSRRFKQMTGWSPSQIRSARR